MDRHGAGQFWIEINCLQQLGFCFIKPVEIAGIGVMPGNQKKIRRVLRGFRGFLVTVVPATK